MSVTDLIPRKKNRDIAVTQEPTLAQDHRDPFLALHREMNRLFDNLWNGFAQPAGFGLAEGLGARPGWPSIDLTESDDAYIVTAELPGVEEKDVEVLIANDQLTLRGEKKAEHDDRRRQLSERYYGRFERRMALPPEVEQDKVTASFRNGILTVTLPKSQDAQQAVRRIPLQS
jgi:HSP20 family protein